MNLGLLLSILSVPTTGGVAATYLWTQRKKHKAIAARLSRWAAQDSVDSRAFTLLKARPWFSDMDLSPNLNIVKNLLTQTGLVLGLNLDDKYYLTRFISIVLALLITPIIIAFAFDWSLLIAAIVGLVLSLIPLFILHIKAGATRTKFCEQLPDAIDLMVAVLRSGLSVSQAVKAVSEESPAPCGREFEILLHKMNLGQPLWRALIASSQKFQSYELDLIRRAVSIQTEVGGSLAELLDKTNDTLRQRLKLARQLKVITSQSRLSAQIVGLLPIVLAIGLNIMNPGYLNLLVQDDLGKSLLMASIVLEILGIYIMHRMSTMKI